MLWRKAWLDTRSRFLVGLGVLALLAAGTVFVALKGGGQGRPQLFHEPVHGEGKIAAAAGRQ